MLLCRTCRLQVHQNAACVKCVVDVVVVVVAAATVVVVVGFVTFF